jgi:hypothetical protein
MSTAAVARGPLRCTHCGREVGETVHTRSSYRVDYYALHTGEVEPMTLTRTADTTPLVTFLKLLRANEVVTCSECYRRPQIRQERELLFRPELMAPSIEEPVP